MDGCQRGNVYGTYIHGIFDKEGIGEAVVEGLMKMKGISGNVQGISYQDYKEEQYERLADMLRESLDMEAIYRIMGLTKNK